jgi:hypothetical protein
MRMIIDFEFVEVVRLSGATKSTKKRVLFPVVPMMFTMSFSQCEEKVMTRRSRFKLTVQSRDYNNPLATLPSSFDHG